MAGRGLKNALDDDFGPEAWNDRMRAEGLLNCLKAEETAKGLLTINDMARDSRSIECDGGR